MNIYKITNEVTGMVYIGKTKHPIEHRWKQHCYDAKSTLQRFRLQEDILKYGKESFRIEKIDEANTDEEACEKEIYWIDFYKSRYPNGYNVSKGGKNGGHMRKVKNVETGEVFETMSDAVKKYNRRIRAIEQALDKPHRTCAGFHWVTIT
jgi:group I intron endonuclease